MLLSAVTEQASQKQWMIKLSVLILGMMSSISAQTAWHKGWSRGQAEEEWKYWLLAAALSPDTGDTVHCSKGFTFKQPEQDKTNSEGRNLPQIKLRH